LSYQHLYDILFSIGDRISLRENTMSDLIFQTVLVVEKEGVLVIEDLPLKKGQRIEIAVYDAQPAAQDAEDPLSLRGEPLYDENPFEPIAVEEWAALQ
jgi:hypothetical protein